MQSYFWDSTLAFAFVDSDVLCSNRLIVFMLEAESSFGVLQSRIHQIWASFFGATLEDRPFYTPTDCYENFPFPEKWETSSALEAASKVYYEFRAALMPRWSP